MSTVDNAALARRALTCSEQHGGPALTTEYAAVLAIQAQARGTLALVEAVEALTRVIGATCGRP